MEPAEAVLANSSNIMGASVGVAIRPNSFLQIKVFILILAWCKNHLLTSSGVKS